MQEFYGIDIERPGCSPLHLACLAAQLGPRSRVWRAVDPGLAWGSAEYIAATVSDQLALLRWELCGCRGKRPEALQRPGAARKSKAPQRASVSRGRLDAILGAPRA